MHIDWYFSLSNSEIHQADYIIFGVPYDSTQTFIPGSRFAPNAIREASWNLEEYSCYFSLDLGSVRVCDAGNINCDGSFREISERVSRFLDGIDGIPIALGGEHTISYSVVRHLVDEYDDICYVVFDAHFDMRDEFDSNKFNHACNLRRILDLGVDILLLGVRSGTAEEIEYAQKNGLKHMFSWDIMERGFASLRDELSSFRKLYISLDMDVFDPAFAPGVSTPEPFGLHPVHFLEFLRIVEPEKVVGFDVVELIPDNSKVTQILAAKLVFEFIASMETKKLSREE
jgi:agmatinase